MKKRTPAPLNEGQKNIIDYFYRTQNDKSAENISKLTRIDASLVQDYLKTLKNG